VTWQIACGSILLFSVREGFLKEEQAGIAPLFP